MHVFFDVDGVLIDGFHHNPERRRRWDTALKNDMGIEPDHFQEFFVPDFMMAIRGEKDLEPVLQNWLARNGFNVSAPDLIRYWLEMDSQINEATYAAVRTLSKIPTLNLYIATNQEHNRARYLWNDLGFKEHFREIFYSAKLGCIKQDPYYFEQIMEQLSLDPAQDKIIYFDDDPKNIETASVLGWDAILYDNASQVRAHPQLEKYFIG